MTGGGEVYPQRFEGAFTRDERARPLERLLESQTEMAGRGVNLLDLVPERTRAFRDEENGRVTVFVPRFGDGRVGRFLQTFVGKAPVSLRLDEIGTAVWRLCDGRRSVYEIGGCLEREFGGRIEPVYERLGVFLHQMKRAGIIDWHAPPTGKTNHA